MRVRTWPSGSAFDYEYDFMIINTELLDNLTVQAKACPRLRQNYDLRDKPEDGSQRMLNAVELGTILPIHRHRRSSETVVILRGKGRWNYFDDKGNMTESIVLDADGEMRALSVPKGQWHTRSRGSTVFIAFSFMNDDIVMYND